MDREVWQATVHGVLKNQTCLSDRAWHEYQPAINNVIRLQHILWFISHWWRNKRLLLLLSHSVVSNSLQPHGLQYSRLPCPSSSPGACSNSCPLSQWCHPTTSSSVIPFSFCFQFFSTSEFFLISWLFVSGGQSTGASASASVLPMNIQDLFPLGWIGLISLQSKGLSRVFYNTAVQKHQFFCA